MNLFDIVLISIALAMDAFAVSICKGLVLTQRSIRSALIVGLYFGVFQTLMPLLGYFFGKSISVYIVSFSAYISFFLLLLLGGNMIYASIKKEEEKKEEKEKALAPLVMLSAAVATSLDAFAVGIIFSSSSVPLFLAVTLIGIITFCISFIGVRIGYLFSERFQKYADILGGIVLICIGFKILLLG